MTFEDIERAQEVFMDSLQRRFSQNREDHSWFTGVGIGFDEGQNNYRLNINVKTKDDICKAEEVIKTSNVNVPYIIKATGVIIAF